MIHHMFHDFSLFKQAQTHFQCSFQESYSMRDVSWKHAFSHNALQISFQINMSIAQSASFTWLATQCIYMEMDHNSFKVVSASIHANAGGEEIHILVVLWHLWLSDKFLEMKFGIKSIHILSFSKIWSYYLILLPYQQYIIQSSTLL